MWELLACGVPNCCDIHARNSYVFVWCFPRGAEQIYAEFDIRLGVN